MKLELKEDGFTLIEVLMASAIIAVALIPLFYSLTTGLVYVSETGSEALTATSLLSQRAEEIKSLPFSEVVPGTQIIQNYADSGYDIKTSVSLMENMTDESGNVVVKKITLEIYEGEKLIGSYSFLIYRGGV